MNIVFAGTPEFALPSLQAVIDSEHSLTGVLTQPDRPAGRGRRLTPSPVKTRALELGVPVQQPESLKSEAALGALRQLAPDLIVVVAYGLILDRCVLALPRYGCINVHASLLPRWRGAAPIARALLAGDRETGVSIMQMGPGLDSGPVIEHRKTAIAEEATAGDLHDALAALGGEVLASVLARVEQGVVAHPQDDDAAVYARRLSKEEAALDWGQTASSLARTVRAFSPWPVAHARLGDQVVRFWRAQAVTAESSAPPGTVTAASADGIDIATGDGLLRVSELQLPGKRRMSAADAANGRQWVGQRFD